MAQNRLDEFCTKWGCSRGELLDLIDEVVSDVNTMNKDQIQRELRDSKATAKTIKDITLEHLKHG